MAKKYDTFVSEVLSALKDLGEMMPMPFETPYAWIRRYSGVPRRKYHSTIHHLRKRGAVKISQRAAKKFIQLTRKGELELLFAKSAKFHKPAKWDGKWRIIMFDIPEQTRRLRNHFRWLLKKNHFIKLQHSVFVSPWPLGRSAVDYLIAAGLKKYIRVLRVDSIDDDADLRKAFRL